MEYFAPDEAFEFLFAIIVSDLRESAKKKKNNKNKNKRNIKFSPRYDYIGGY